MSLFNMFKPKEKCELKEDSMSSAIERMALMNATKQNTKFFSLEGQIFEAKIVYIYDGDTMHVVFSLFNKTYKWNCRVMGVDTPEVRTRNLKEKEMGIRVRDILREKLQDKIVKIKCFDFDKYGRLLIDLCFEFEPGSEMLLSQWLIQNKYAYEYNGGTKQSWDL